MTLRTKMTLRGCCALCSTVAAGFITTSLPIAGLGCGECRTLGGHLFEPRSHCFHPVRLLDEACGQQVQSPKKGSAFICLVSPEGDVYSALLGDSERVRTAPGWRTFPVGENLVSDAVTQSVCREAITTDPWRTQCPGDAGISALSPC